MKIHQLDTAREARAIREINELHAVQEKAIDRAIRIGELLTECLAPLSHGDVANWLKANVPFGKTTAYDYMTAFKRSKIPDSGILPETIQQATKPKKRASTTIIGKATGKQIGGTQKRKLKAAGVDIDARMEEGSAQAEEVIAKATAILGDPTEAVNELRFDLTEKQKLTFDQKMERALAIQQAAQEATFWDRVIAEVNKRVPAEKAEALQTIKEYNIKLQGLRGQLDIVDYRKLLSVLHPDKRPSDAERAEAFNIVRKLDQYVQIANRT